MFVIPFYFVCIKKNRRIYRFYLSFISILHFTKYDYIKQLANVPKIFVNIRNLGKFSGEFYVLSEVISGNCTGVRARAPSKIDGILRLAPISHDLPRCKRQKKKEKKKRNQGRRRMQKGISRKVEMGRRRHGLTALGG